MSMFEQGVNTNGETLRSVYVVHEPVDLDCQAADDGMTRQEFADECDINVLMARYEKTGVINHWNRTAPAYLDLSDVPDLHQALTILEDAKVAFMTLPAVVRREFDNDAVKFVEYAQDEKNIDRMREWGLAAPAPVEPSPVRVEVVNPAGSGGA